VAQHHSPEDEQLMLEEFEHRHYLLDRNLFGYDVCFSYTKNKHRFEDRIAIVILHSQNIWARRVLKGIISSLTNAFAPERPPIFDIYSAEASNEHLQNKVFTHMEQRRKDYRVVITVDSWVSKRVHTYLKDNGWSATQVFLGVRDPVADGLVRSLTDTSGRIVGVIGAVQDYGRQVELLKAIRPHTKIALIPYDPVYTYGGFEEDLQRVMYHLEKVGIEARTVEIALKGEIKDQIIRMIKGVDVIWGMREAAVQAHIKPLVALCNESGITLCTSELASVFQGAALGFGDSGTLLGAYGGQVCFALYTESRRPDQMGVFEITHPHVLRINPNQMEKQGLKFTKEQIALIRGIIPLGWD